MDCAGVEAMTSKTKWFPVPDSLTKRSDGKPGSFYNIEARFSDHLVTTSGYDTQKVSTILEMRIVNTGFGRGLASTSSHPIRFDKGKALRKEALEEMVALICRCHDAWGHYQHIRTAPVTPLEVEAMIPLANTPPVMRTELSVQAIGGPVTDEPEEIWVAPPSVKPTPVKQSSKQPKSRKKASPCQ